MSVEVKEVVIEEGVSELLASDEHALRKRFNNGAIQHFGCEILGDGVIRLVVRDPRLISFGKLNIDEGDYGPLGDCNSLVHVDLSGCSSLITLGDALFNCCRFLQQVTFPDSLRSLGAHVFAHSALTSLVLPARVETMGIGVFDTCTALTSVSLPVSLRNVEAGCFAGCSKLAKVVLSAPVSFRERAFERCTRMIELADAAGFPSTINEYGNTGESVGPYLLDRFYNDEKKKIILRAMRSFLEIVHHEDGSEAEKVEAARLRFPQPFPSMGQQTAGDFLKYTREGVLGVLGDVLQFV